MTVFSVLDYGIRDEGVTTAEALSGTIRLAQRAEALGFHRFWVAEHHNVPAFTCSAPEIMMMHLLHQTHRIRIGSGGIMLPHYSPLKVAEQLKTLLTFFPDRVDIGIGNNPGVPPARTALNEHRQTDADYYDQLDDLRYYMGSRLDSAHRFSEMVVHPEIQAESNLFVLTTGSQDTAKYAGEHGLGYVHGLFLAGEKGTAKGLKTYRMAHQSANHIHKPYTIGAIAVGITDDEELVRWLQRSLEIWLLGKSDYREFNAFPSLSTSKAYRLTPEDQQAISRLQDRFVVGTADVVRARLDRLIELYGFDELLILPLIPLEVVRIHTLSVLSAMYID